MDESERASRSRAEYAQKLRDPRWQKKRLRILERDNFTCRFCKETTATLHVHHQYYLPEQEPWDYPDEALITLCWQCHEDEAQFRRRFEQELLQILRQIGVSTDHLNYLCYALGELPKEPMSTEGTAGKLISLLLPQIWDRFPPPNYIRTCDLPPIKEQTNEQKSK